MATTHLLHLGAEPLRVTIGDGTYSERNGSNSWEHTAYRVTVTYQARVLWFTYRQGMSWPVDAVNPRNALESIVLDYRSFENTPNYFDFCDEYGYDPAALSSVTTYRALERIRNSIDRVFRSATDRFLSTYVER
jgi:hypothetical protein